LKRHFNQQTKVYHRNGTGGGLSASGWERRCGLGLGSAIGRSGVVLVFWGTEWLAASPDSGFGRVFAGFVFVLVFVSISTSGSDLPHFLFVASKMFSHQLGPEKIFSGHLARLCDLFDAFRQAARKMQRGAVGRWGGSLDIWSNYLPICLSAFLF